MSEQRADDVPPNVNPNTKEEARRLADLLLELADEGLTLTISAKEGPSPRLASTRWRSTRPTRRGGLKATGSSKAASSKGDRREGAVSANDIEALRARIQARRETLTKHGL